MKNVFWILSTFVIIFTSCNHSKKEVSRPLMSEASKGFDTLKVYNNVLNNLIENHLYYTYLGREWEDLYVALNKKKIDSITYLKKINAIKENVVKKNYLRGTLYIDENFNGYKKDITFLPSLNGFDIIQIKVHISKKNHLSVDSLKSDFVKLKSLSNKDTLKLFEVGKLGLSKLLFNKDKSLGILYFEFICGAKCGEGSIILIKKTNDLWCVDEKYTLWEI